MVFELEITEVTTKDIAKIFHWTTRTAQRKISLLRDAYGMQKHQIVTLDRFCEYYGIEKKHIHIKHNC